MEQVNDDIDEYISILDELDLLTEYYNSMDEFRSKYTDIEFEARKNIYVDLFREDIEALQIIKKRLSKSVRFKIWCSRWLKKLTNKSKKK